MVKAFISGTLSCGGNAIGEGNPHREVEPSGVRPSSRRRPKTGCAVTKKRSRAAKEHLKAAKTAPSIIHPR